MTIKERAAAATSLLKEAYPDAACALQYEKDYELLFSARLSAQCTDARVNIVTRDLYVNFPTLQSFADASIEDLEAGIKTCGLYHTKARDLKAAAQMLLQEFGGKVPDNMADLLRLPGVGRKTANLVLGDIYGQPAVVTDTHCIRLSNRLGLVKNLKNPAKVETALRQLLDPQESSNFCHRLVLHGRAVCTARNPHCQSCCLASICMSFPLSSAK